jgi:hypothetical protein
MCARIHHSLAFQYSIIESLVPGTKHSSSNKKKYFTSMRVNSAFIDTIGKEVELAPISRL